MIWMIHWSLGAQECASAAPVGSRDFKLLRRNGGAQQAETSASRLVAMRMEGSLQRRPKIGQRRSKLVP
jgi:hypothetical protein